MMPVNHPSCALVGRHHPASPAACSSHGHRRTQHKRVGKCDVGSGSSEGSPTSPCVTGEDEQQNGGRGKPGRHDRGEESSTWAR
jgi:hypothetical protein